MTAKSTSMVKDAEAHAAEDAEKQKLVDARNQADQLVYSTEKTLSEHGDKVDAETRGQIEKAVNNLKDAQKSDNAETITNAINELNQVSHKLAEEVYKASSEQGANPAGAAAQATAGAGAANAGSSSDDDVIDADFEVKN
jgi:molecular chaperone DnaK